MRQKTCLIFDLDYTLIENKFYPSIYEYIISAVDAKNLSVNELRTRFIGNFRKWINRGLYIEAFDWDKLLEFTLRELGFEPNVTFTEAFVENFMSGRAKVFEGVKRFLNNVKKLGHVVGVLSNGVWRFQKITLSLTGLINIIDFVITSDQAKSIKPFPRIFEMGQEECLKREAKRIYFFGDSLLFDIVGSLASGYNKAFWLTDETKCFEVKLLDSFRDKIKREMESYGISLDINDLWGKEVYLYRNYECLEEYFFSKYLL